MSHNLNEENSVIKDDLDINGWFLYKSEADKEYYKDFIIRAKSSREWMDQPPTKFIYNCIPIVCANSFGWWILNSQDIEVEWDGGVYADAVTIKDHTEGRNYNLVSSHFGSGILTFNIPMLFQTPAGWGLWVGGASNTFIDGIFALEGLVETNWAPFTFTMNYKITRPNHVIKIPKYYPICRIVPFQLNLNDKFNFKLLNDNPQLHTKQVEWHDARKKNLQEHKENNPVRMHHYRDGIDVKGCPFTGMHKLFYKYKQPKIDDK